MLHKPETTLVMESIRRWVLFTGFERRGKLAHSRQKCGGLAEQRRGPARRVERMRRLGPKEARHGAIWRRVDSLRIEMNNKTRASVLVSFENEVEYTEKSMSWRTF